MSYLRIVLFVLLSIVIFTASSRAQESTPTNSSDFRIGIGVSLDLGRATESQVSPSSGSNDMLIGVPLLYPASPLTFLIPMRFGNFKVEPEIGVFSYSNTANGSKDSTGVTIGETDVFSLTAIRVGAGLYYTQQMAGNLSAYIGPRFGIITNSSELDRTPPPADTGQFGQKPSTAKISRTDFFVGLTLGGEYFFSSAFSLGADVGIEYVSLGTQSTTVTPVQNSVPGAITGHSFETKEAVVARVYF